MPEGVILDECPRTLLDFQIMIPSREKSFSIFRGSVCWLSRFDCTLFSEFGRNRPTDSKFGVRIQLATLEDEVYRLHHSPKRSSARYKKSLQHLEQSLEYWVIVNEVFRSAYVGTHDADLQFEFLSARICTRRKSFEPGYVCRVLSDSRASCLLVVIFYGKYELSMIEQFDILLLSERSSERFSGNFSGRSSKSGKVFSPEFISYEASEYVPSRFHKLLDVFAVPAFFLLVMNLVWSSSVDNELNAEEDLILLRMTCACFKEVRARIQANNHIRKVGQAFEGLFEVIDLVGAFQQPQSSRFDIQQSSNVHDTANTSTPFSEQYQPPESWESFSETNTSAKKSDSLGAGVSPGSLTLIDLYYQPYNPLHPSLFPNDMHQQQQLMQPPVLTRPHMNEPDVSMDDFANPMLISEFLKNNPAKFFEVTPQNQQGYF